MYPPLAGNVSQEGVRMDLAILRLHIAGASSIMASVNFITTIIKGKGRVKWRGYPLFI